jgi:hypothetical protein
MNKATTPTVLYYPVYFRLFIAVILSIVLLGISIVLGKIIQNYPVLKKTDIIPLIISLLLLFWITRLFFDCWRTVVLNNSYIEIKFCTLTITKISWNDIVGFEEKKTNQVNNLIQCKTLVLIYDDGKKVSIPEKLKHYESLLDGLRRNSNFYIS